MPWLQDYLQPSIIDTWGSVQAWNTWESGLTGPAVMNFAPALPEFVEASYFDRSQMWDGILAAYPWTSPATAAEPFRIGEPIHFANQFNLYTDATMQRTLMELARPVIREAVDLSSINLNNWSYIPPYDPGVSLVEPGWYPFLSLINQRSEDLHFVRGIKNRVHDMASGAGRIVRRLDENRWIKLAEKVVSYTPQGRTAKLAWIAANTFVTPLVLDWAGEHAWNFLKDRALSNIRGFLPLDNDPPVEDDFGPFVVPIGPDGNPQPVLLYRTTKGYVATR